MNLRLGRIITGAALTVAALHVARPVPSRADAGPLRAGGFELHGILDLIGSDRGPGLDYNGLSDGTNTFDPYRMRLFLSGPVSSRLDVFAQVGLSDHYGARLYGSHAQWTPRAETDLHLELGKLPWAVGTWGPRTYSNRNPLIGTPLLYSYPTALPANRIVTNADQLIKTPDPVSFGAAYDSTGARERGMHIVDDANWDFGATLRGSARPLEYAIGFVNGTPGAPRPGGDDNAAKSVVGRAGLMPLPGVRFGVSGAWGAYLPSALDPALPAGHNASDYHQRLAMADLELLAGHFEVRAEGAVNVWETPAFGDLRLHGGYAEGRWTFAPGFYAAARYDALRFSEVLDSAGTSVRWDRNLDRIESGIGWIFDRHARLKGVYQRTTVHESDEDESYPYDLWALQLALSF